MTRILGLAFALSLLAPAVRGDDYDLAAGTSRYVSMDRICQDLATAAAEDGGGGKTLVVWVVDNASVLKTHRVLEDLFRAIVAAYGKPEGDFGEVHMAVVAFTEKPRILCAPTNRIEEVASAFDELGAKTDDAFKNACKIVRDAAAYFGRWSGFKARHMVLVTLENGDNEEHLEPTLATLARARFRFFAVSREAILSDPYWSRFPHQAQGVEFELRGPDAPVEELPWGYSFQWSPAHEAVASGFGIYGLNRLVAATKGKYYLYYPDVPGASYCASRGCLLCSGRHGRCHTAYDPSKLSIFAPSTDERNRYRALMNREPNFRLALAAWEQLYGQGLVQSPPPFLLEGKSIVPNDRNAPRPAGLAMGQIVMANQIPALAATARKALPEVEKLIQLVDRALGDKKVDLKRARAQAIAEILRLQLEALRFNLRQLVLFDEYLKNMLAAKGKPFPDELSVNPVTGAPGAYVYVYLENYTFCHGKRRIEPVRFLGGYDARREAAKVADRAVSTIDRYQNTPFELVARRVGLVWFRVYEVVPVQGNTANQNRPNARSTQEEQATETAGPQRQATPARDRGGRPSGVTSGG